MNSKPVFMLHVAQNLCLKSISVTRLPILVLYNRRIVLSNIILPRERLKGWFSVEHASLTFIYWKYSKNADSDPHILALMTYYWICSIWYAGELFQVHQHDMNVRHANIWWEWWRLKLVLFPRISPKPCITLTYLIKIFWKKGAIVNLPK